MRVNIAFEDLLMERRRGTLARRGPLTVRNFQVNSRPVRGTALVTAATKCIRKGLAPNESALSLC